MCLDCSRSQYINIPPTGFAEFSVGLKCDYLTANSVIGDDLTRMSPEKQKTNEVDDFMKFSVAYFIHLRGCGMCILACAITSASFLFQELPLLKSS